MGISYESSSLSGRTKILNSCSINQGYYYMESTSSCVLTVIKLDSKNTQKPSPLASPMVSKIDSLFGSLTSDSGNIFELLF